MVPFPVKVIDMAVTIAVSAAVSVNELAIFCKGGGNGGGGGGGGGEVVCRYPTAAP